MSNEERKNTIYEELETIYDEFADRLIDHGWNGMFYGYTETCRGNADGSGFKMFSLDNGFKMMFTNPMERDEETSLTYWFDDNDVAEVGSWEELAIALLMKD